MANENFTAAGAASYSNYEQAHAYETSLGVVVVPVATRNAAFRIIRLHGGYALRRVNWTATRAGKPPIVPTPASTANDTIIGFTVTPHLPSPIPNDVGYNWMIEGEYLYVQNTPRVLGTHTLPTGAYPFSLGASDEVGGRIAQKHAVDFNVPNPGSIDAADSLFTALSTDTDIVNHQTDSFVWPFTVLPPGFTNDFLIRG